MSEIDRSSGTLVALARTRTVGDCFGRFFYNLARDEPSSLLTEIALTHSKFTVHGQQSATSGWVRGRYRYLLLLRKVAALQRWL